MSRLFLGLLVLCCVLLSVSASGFYGHAVIRSTTLGPNLSGTITFSQPTAGSTVKILLSISGMPVGLYGIHIHLYGDGYDVNATGAGTHFNPYNTPHGCWPDTARHAGDIGNFSITNSGGVTNVTFVRDLMDLSTAGSIIGRSLIIHAMPDNCQQPTGNAGSWIGQGVIGIASPTIFGDDTNLAVNNLAAEPTSAIAVFHPLNDAGAGSKIAGWIQFQTQSDGKVHVTSAIYNVPASTISGAVNIHAVHVHVYGHDEPTGAVCGGHFNANSGIHGPLSDPTRHSGDLGNYTLTLNSKTQLYDGTLNIVTPDPLLSLTSVKGNAIGRGVILHADRDDGNPTHDPSSTGSAGKRIAIGIIGVSGRALVIPSIHDEFAERFAN